MSSGESARLGAGARKLRAWWELGGGWAERSSREAARGGVGRAEQRAASDVVGGTGWRSPADPVRGGSRWCSELGAATGSRAGRRRVAETEQGRPRASRLRASDPGGRRISEVSLSGTAPVAEYGREAQLEAVTSTASTGDVSDHHSDLPFFSVEVNAQRGSRTAEVVQSLNDIDTWKAFKEPIPQDVSRAMYSGNQLFEHLSTTEDETDYLWYVVSYEYRPGDDGQFVLLNVESRAHMLHAFVNNEYVGSVHGSHDGPGNIVLNTHINLKEGQNAISLLSVMVGSPDSGAHMERRIFGIRKVSIQQGHQPDN